MSQKPADLSNWRSPPHNRWSFSHVDELIATATIAHGTAVPLPSGPALDLARVQFSSGSVADFLVASSTDGFLVLHKGRLVAETYPNMGPWARHILFSVSKSVTGALAGVLVGEGKLDPDAPVLRYLPEVKASAYGTCTVRHVLDMTVDLDFVENYLDTMGDFARYRVSTGWNPPNAALGTAGLHEFLATVKPGAGRHGEKFYYVSPNSDLLGWILERAAGQPLAQLMAEKLWQPLGAEVDAFVTVDAKGAARTAGGINTSLRDLARFGEMMRNHGRAGGRQVVPAEWVQDIRENGSREAWARGSMTHLFPQGSYRSKWYKANDADGSFFAIGIHGQWIYVNPARQVTAVKFSSQPEPVVDAIEVACVEMFGAIARALG
ncbi:MAG: serine hydrolase [Alphaproteobacteria bacterium]|nr:serine hydrolase [Alphaproteobacteria bacterium]